MNTSTEIGELAKALSKCQSMIHGALKSETNPFFKSKYADLTSVWEACKIPLTENGLSVSQGAHLISGHICLVTRLMHESGQWIQTELPLPEGKSDAQALGSKLSYCRRYQLAAIVGVCPIDDDGEAAMAQEESRIMHAFKKITEHLHQPDLWFFVDAHAKKRNITGTQVVRNWVQYPEKGIQSFLENLAIYKEEMGLVSQ